MEITNKIKNIKSEFPIINAIIGQNQKGQIFEKKGNYFIMNQAGFSQLHILNPLEFNPVDFANFIAKEEGIPRYLHIYTPPKVLLQHFRDDNRFNIKLRTRIQLRYLKKQKEAVNHSKNQYILERIDKTNFFKLDQFNLNIESTFWESETDFLKHGYGVIIYDEIKRPVSVCYSAAIANNVTEIDILTKKEFQGKGFAYIATLEFINYSLKLGYKPNWDCFEENFASLKTAEKANFKELKKYNFISIYKN